jgi:hypothetical protein
MLHCKRSFIFVCHSADTFPTGPIPMSRQLSVSAAFSAFTMALFALAMRAGDAPEAPGSALETPLAAEISLG